MISMEFYHRVKTQVKIYPLTFENVKRQGFKFSPSNFGIVLDLIMYTYINELGE